MNPPSEGFAETVGTNTRRIATTVYQFILSGRVALDVVTTTVNDRFRTVLAVFLVAFLGTFYTLRLWAWDRIQADLLARDATIVAAEPLEVVVVQARIGAGVGFVLAAIAVAYLARDAFLDWRPRVDSLSRRAIAGLSAVAAGLFVAGVAMAYLGLVPVLFGFLATNAIESGFRPTYSIAQWTSFVLLYSFWVGLAALLPLVIGTMTRLGVASYKSFRRRWLYAVLGIVVLSSVLNWSIDPLTVFFAAAPMVVAYGIGLGGTKVTSAWRTHRTLGSGRTSNRNEAEKTKHSDQNTVTEEGDSMADPSLNDGIERSLETVVRVANAFSSEELTAAELFEYGRQAARLFRALKRSAVYTVGTFVLITASVFTALHWGGLEAITRDFRTRLPGSVRIDRLAVVSLYPTEVLGFETKVSVALGFIAALPLFLYYSWPTLRKREHVRGDRPSLLGWIGVFGFSLAGIALLSYVFVAPSVVAALLRTTTEANVIPLYQVSELFFLVFFLTVGVGLVIEVPLTLVLLHRMGIVSYRAARRYWLPVTVVILLFISPLTQGTLAKLVISLPLVLAYGVGVRALRTRFAAGTDTDSIEPASGDSRPFASLTDRWIPPRDQQEVRRRLTMVLAVTTVASGLAFVVADRVITPVWNSLLPATSAPRAYMPLALLVARLKVALLVGVVVALPVAVHQVYSYRSTRHRFSSHERQWYLVAVPASLILSLLGTAVALWIVLPVLFTYLLTYARPVAVLAFGLTSTFGVIISLVGFFALTFQIPLAVLLAVATGVATRSWFFERRLYVWGGLGAAAFALSPDPTGVAPTILAVIAIALFEGGLVLSLVVHEPT